MNPEVNLWVQTTSPDDSKIKKEMINPQTYLKKSNSIAIVRTDRLGDMILTLPMYSALKKIFPEKKISLIASSYTEPLLEDIEIINDVFYIDKTVGGIKAIFKNNKFDLMFFPRPKFDEVFEAFTNRIPLRVGTGYRWYSMLFNHRVYEHRKSAERHEAEYNLNLISSITGTPIKPELVRPQVHEENKNSVVNILSQFGLGSNEKLIVIHPGSGGSSYDWPPDNFGQLSSWLSVLSDYKVIITGTDAEKQLCSYVAGFNSESINLCEMLTMKELFTLLSMSSLFIGNSSGVIHIAAALGKPVIGLYPNSPHLSARRWGPYTDNSIIISPPISSDKRLRDDMSRIKFEIVFKAVNSMLRNN